MNAKDLPDLVVDYLYDELDPEQRAAFEAALPEAPEVRAEVEAFQRTREAFAGLDELDVPSGISDKLMAEAARVAPAPQRKSLLERIRAGLSLMVMHPAMSAAAVMVVVLGVSLYVYRHGGPPSRVPKADTPALPAARPAALAEDKKVTLARADEEAKQAKQAKPAAKAAFAYQRRQGGPAQAAPTKDSERPRLRRRSKLAGGSLDGALGSGGSARDYKNQLNNKGLYRGVGKKSAGRKTADSMHNIAGDRRERAAARALAKAPGSDQDDGLTGKKAKKGKRARVSKAPRKTQQLALAPQAAAPKSKPKPSKKPSKRDAEQATAQRWLELGSSAVASKRCPEAFDYFTRALKAKPSLLARISAQLGSCRAALQRSGSHAWLRGQIRRQERRPARRKARRRRVIDQRVQEAK